MSDTGLFSKSFFINDEEPPKQIIYLIHDLFLSHKFFESFIHDYSVTTSKSIQFIVIDLPGHGYDNGPRGHMENFEEALEGLAKVICETDSPQSVKTRSVISFGCSSVLSLIHI